MVKAARSASLPPFSDGGAGGRDADGDHGGHDNRRARDFTYIADVVDGVLRACTADVSGLVLNVATGSRISLNELFRVLRGLTGRTDVNPSYGPGRAGDVRDSQADISKARQLMGYEPLVAFEEGLRRTVEWYRTEYANQ